MEPLEDESTGETVPAPESTVDDPGLFSELIEEEDDSETESTVEVDVSETTLPEGEVVVLSDEALDPVDISETLSDEAIGSVDAPEALPDWVLDSVEQGAPVPVDPVLDPADPADPASTGPAGSVLDPGGAASPPFN